MLLARSEVLHRVAKYWFENPRNTSYYVCATKVDWLWPNVMDEIQIEIYDEPVYDSYSIVCNNFGRFFMCGDSLSLARAVREHLNLIMGDRDIAYVRVIDAIGNERKASQNVGILSEESSF